MPTVRLPALLLMASLSACTLVLGGVDGLENSGSTDTTDNDAGESVLDENGCPPAPCEMNCGPAGQRRDAAGCAVCECVDPRLCRADGDCLRGTRCDLERFCEKDPSCAGDADGACPSVCLGRCMPTEEGVVSVDQAQCDVVSCDLRCPDGFAADSNGCLRCACRNAPTRCESLQCEVLCPSGYASDERGCPTCQCLQPDPCNCPPGGEPVCSDDGRTFDNACRAKCAGVGFRPGVCDPAMGGCPPDVKPVCGEDKVTYANPCEADRARVRIVAEGPCGGCICTADYRPVCGADGRTYPNACTAQCLQQGFVEGECPSDRVCPQEYAPVCAEGGRSFPNKCEAERAGAVIVSDGPCAVCDCPPDIKPVCGDDGREYPNDCAARCAGRSFKDGPCAEALICPEKVDPVCGADGVTYVNACEAQRIGIAIVHGGPCGCTREWNPVCGADGRTYPNPCVAKEAGQVDVKLGECPRPCETTDQCQVGERCEGASSTQKGTCVR